MYYFMYFCIKINKYNNIVMKTRLTIIAVMLIGFSACAPKYTCPAYSIERGQGVKAEKIEQMQM